MILRMRSEGIRHVPIVFCSFCENEIRKAEGASFAYCVDGVGDKILFALHDSCIDGFEQKTGVEDLGTVPLQCFPIYLLHVQEIDYEQAKRNANQLSRI